MIKEIIVVEGKDDEAAVKRAVDAEVISVHGFGITEATFRLLKKASKEKGIIVLTDPDHAGETIRKRIEEACGNVKHAYIMRKDSLRKGDIGVENASPEVIREALKNAHATLSEKREEFTVMDLHDKGMMGRDDSALRREKIGKALGIGFSNSSTMLKRLNNYGITREAFEKACEVLEDE